MTRAAQSSERGGVSEFRVAEVRERSAQGAQLPAAPVVILHEIFQTPNPRPAVGEDRGTRCGLLGRWGESPPECGVA